MLTSFRDRILGGSGGVGTMAVVGTKRCVANLISTAKRERLVSVPVVVLVPVWGNEIWGKTNYWFFFECA